MATIRQHTATLLVPTIFFGYALYANSTLLISSTATDAHAAENKNLSLSYVIDGEATRDLDALYKKELPHREPSVGVFGNARYAVLGAGRKGVVIGDDHWFFTTEEFKKVSQADISDAVERIDGIRKQLAERGITLVVAPLPAKSDIYAEELPGRLQSSAMADAYEAFSAALRDKGLTVADTRTALVQAKPFDPVFLKSDTHWTPHGAKATAAAIQTTLQAAGLTLPQQQVTAQWQTPVSIWGDLTRYVTSPEYAPAAGLTQENLPIYRTTAESPDAGADLFGDSAGAPVMLVGTSYSANENWSFVDFLRESLSTDVVNVAKEGLGPGVPMLDLLEGGVLDESTPSVVVWEFPVRFLGTKTLWKRVTSEPEGGHHNA